MIEYCRLKIEYLRCAFSGSILKAINEPLAASRRGSFNAKEILSQQAAGN
jgi:hypothetical protein